MAKNLSIVAQGISGEEGKLLGYNVTDNGIYTPAIGDVARDTTATYVAQDGTIKTAAENVARVDYTNGVAELLLEPASKNLVTYSEDFSKWLLDGNNGSVESGFGSPDGGNNAYKLYNNGESRAYRYVIVGNSSTSDATFSVYVKDATPSINGDKEIRLMITNSDFITFNLDTEEFSNPTTSVSNYGFEYIDGFYRIYATFIGVSGNYISSIELLNAYMNNVGSGVYIFGAQIEQLPYPTSYIPNFGNSAGQTRGADSLTNFGSEQIIDSSSGILFFEGSSIGFFGTPNIISMNDGSSSNDIRIVYFSENQVIFYASAVGNIELNKIIETDISQNQKYALKYNQGNYEWYINGVLINDLSSGSSIVGLNKLIFNTAYGDRPFYGRVRQLKHLPYNTDITTL